jgi:hypothetical protein
MKIVNNKITKATEAELHKYYLTRGYDDIYSFPEFIERMKECGVVITDSKGAG